MANSSVLNGIWFFELYRLLEVNILVFFLVFLVMGISLTYKHFDLIS